jgi:hypothetical protein
MGLFDSLPAPTKAAPKRDPDSLAEATAEEGTAKKPRQDAYAACSAEAPGGQQQQSASAGGGSGGAAAAIAWTGSLDAAFSEDKGSRLTMEGGCYGSLE